MSDKCDVKGGCCETTQDQSGCNESCGCGCQESSSCCPIEKATTLWKSSFFQAMKQAQVDVLKQKIQKAWGAKLDKTADAVLEAMEAQWNAALTQGKAEIDLKEKITRIITEGKK